MIDVSVRPTRLDGPDGADSVHSLADALDRMAATAASTLGFAIVVVNLRRADGMFEVIAGAGLPEGMAGPTTTPEFWSLLTRERDRVSESYLAPPSYVRTLLDAHGDALWEAPRYAEEADGGAWDPYHMLLVPLRDRTGAVTGYFSVDAPLDGRVPGAERIGAMETFARHAALAVEHAQLVGELGARVDHLGALLRVSLDISGSLDPEVTFRSVVRIATELLGADGGGLYLLDERRERVELKASIKPHRDAAERTSLRVGEGVVGEVALSGMPTVVQDVELDPRVVRSTAERAAVRALAAVPVKFDGRVVGVLGAVYTRPHAVPDAAVELLESIAAQAALAIGNAELHDDTRKQAERLRVLGAIAGRLNRINDLESIGAAIAQELRGLIEYHACRVFALAGDRLQPIAIYGEHAEYSRDRLGEVRLGQGVTGWVALRGEAVLLDDAGRDPRSSQIPDTPILDESMLAAPMQYEGRVVGVITLSKLGLGRFAEADLHLLETLADQAAVAVENAHLVARVEAETRREGEERFRSLVAHVSDVLMVLGEDGTLRYVSPAVHRVLGYDPERLVGANSFMLLHPDDLPTARVFFARLLRGPGTHEPVQLRLRTSDGSSRYIEVVANNRLGDPSIGGVVVVCRDVTERRLAEEELRRSEERFELAIRGANDGLWDWDLPTDTVYYSPRSKEMLGYADDELPNEAEAWRGRIHPEDYPRSLVTLEAYLAGETSAYEVEHRLRHKDGAYRWILARGAVIRDADGRPRRMAGSHTDVTTRREAEELLRRRNGYLAALHETTLALLHRREIG